MKSGAKWLASLLVFALLLTGLSSCVELEQKTKEGATVGAVAGGVLGVLLDKNNRWRGAVVGATLGALIGPTEGRGPSALARLGMFYVHCQGVTSFSFTLNGVLLFNTP
jgi:hypothetical protein